MRTTPTAQAILTLRRLVREPMTVEGRMLLRNAECHLLAWLARERFSVAAE